MAQLKVVFLGPPNTGKSSLIAALEGKQFECRPHQQTPAPKSTTIKTEAKTKIYQPANHIVWEVPGQPQYQQLSCFYTEEAHVIALVFDLTNAHTLENLDLYTMPHLKDSGRIKAHVVLVGMKSDARLSYRRAQWISPDKITDFKDRHKISKENYVEISARTQEGIDKFKKILDDHTLAQLKYRSLSDRKNNFIDILSQYKQNREKRGNSLFGFSKQEKINAATKAMACFYGADKVVFSKNERAALRQKGSQLEESILKALNPNDHNIQLLKSLFETRKQIASSNSSYKEALIQFLSDYQKMRSSHTKEYYFFGCGIDKNTKISAVKKLIARLNNEVSDSFTEAEIRAINDGSLRKIIKTTLSWFSNAPALEQFIRDNTADLSTTFGHTSSN